MQEGMNYMCTKWIQARDKTRTKEFKKINMNMLISTEMWES